MRIVLDEGAFKPTREHSTDAGLDIRAMKCGCVRAGQSAVFHTGVHVELPENTAGIFISKSGLMMNHDITSTGLVDEGYQGEIVVKLFNHGYEDYNVRRGDKISQFVITPVLYEDVEVIAGFDYCTERGGCGFGSTGR
jgi:dUTP pyrophosphatase